jgi:effector-binding domain-containing protein
MTSEPRIVERGAQRYVSITTRATMDRFSEIADALPELFGWLDEHGIAPVGAPFFRYNSIDMTGLMEVEAGVPVAEPHPGDERVGPGQLPAGRYATAMYLGHPRGLLAATRELLEWGQREGVRWDMSTVDGDERWAARLERYLSDPAVQPDMHKWETELAFKLAG